MSDFDKYSSLQPPTDILERAEWFRVQEERIAALVRSELSKLIDGATEAFINSLTATGDMSYFDQIPMLWTIWVEDVLLEELQGMFLAGGLTAVTAPDGSLRLVDSLIDAWIEIINQDAVDYALVAENRMKDVGMNAWNDIKNKVSQAIEKGTSNDDLRKLLVDNNRFSRVRADAIARTEVATAYNNGNWNSMEALGEYGPTYKFWIHAEIGNSRPEHLNKHGKMLPLNEPYSLEGGELALYPHAPGMSARNAVNCRCEVYWLYPGQSNPITGEVVPDLA